MQVVIDVPDIAFVPEEPNLKLDVNEDDEQNKGNHDDREPVEASHQGRLLLTQFEIEHEGIVHHHNYQVFIELYQHSQNLREELQYALQQQMS